MTPTPMAEATDFWGVAVPTWIAAGSAFIGATASLLGVLVTVGALWVAILSYRRSTRAGVAEDATRDVVEGVLRLLAERRPEEPAEPPKPTGGYWSRGPDDAAAKRRERAEEQAAEFERLLSQLQSAPRATDRIIVDWHGTVTPPPKGGTTEEKQNPGKNVGERSNKPGDDDPPAPAPVP